MKTCPKCKSANTCEIRYGYPADEEEYLKLVAEKKIYPGGRCIEDDLPVWFCNDCENKWGRCGDSQAVDFFYYDKKSNPDEVRN